MLESLSIFKSRQVSSSNTTYRSRRAFLRSALLGASAAALCGTAAAASVQSTTGLHERTFFRVPVRGLNPVFEGYRIGFVTDLHLSMFYPHEWLEAALAGLGGECDLLLLGGDYLWIPDRRFQRDLWWVRNPRCAAGGPAELPERILVDVAQIISKEWPPDGVIGCLGNHDRWSDHRLCARAFARQGIRLLINEWFTLQRGPAALHFWSTDDYWNGIPQLPAAPRSPAFLLTHNPDFALEERNTVSAEFDFVFCGHTHGGQVKLPGIGALTYNIAHREYGEGMARLGTRCGLYVARGLGMVELPFRLNCPGETTIFELTAASSEPHAQQETV